MKVLKKVEPNFIVGIGGSAGGLDAYKALLDALPPDTGMAFVIVAHLLPSAHSQLVEILAKYTKMPVLLAASGMPIWGNHVYVIPPNADLVIDGNAFEVIMPRIRGNTQVDIFFVSLAEVMRERAVGIILSGYDGDGTEGCRQIKAKGGTTFAQDTSAAVGSMSLSAQDSGYVDFVLPPEKIPAELQKMVLTSTFH